MAETIIEKFCRSCRVNKPIDDFYKSKLAKDKHFADCKPCTQQYYKDRYAANLYVREKNRNRLLLARYAITLADFQALSSDQDHKCAICRRTPESIGKRELAVDHNHDTGKVRGLLCTPCNTTLGKWNDDPEIVLRAFHYLQLSR